MGPTESIRRARTAPARGGHDATSDGALVEAWTPRIPPWRVRRMRTGRPYRAPGNSLRRFQRGMAGVVVRWWLVWGPAPAPVPGVPAGAGRDAGRRAGQDPGSAQDRAGPGRGGRSPRADGVRGGGRGR